VCWAFADYHSIHRCRKLQQQLSHLDRHSVDGAGRHVPGRPRQRSSTLLLLCRRPCLQDPAQLADGLTKSHVGVGWWEQLAASLALMSTAQMIWSRRGGPQDQQQQGVPRSAIMLLISKPKL
jgi:hypothetical protein